LKSLLDTQALLWWLADDERLGPACPCGNRGCGERDRRQRSVALVWEIAVKVRVGKLSADIDEVADVIERDGFISLGILRSHLAVLAGLPLHHRDPFDQLLIAQAINEGATFISDGSYCAIC
jgi:PIN domain nuclease of toxin-antitoxin system